MGIVFLIIFVFLEDGRIKNLTEDVPGWYMKMDYGRHIRFNKKNLFHYRIYHEREIEFIVILRFYIDI